jgi:hypothetical protein
MHATQNEAVLPVAPDCNGRDAEPRDRAAAEVVFAVGHFTDLRGAGDEEGG